MSTPIWIRPGDGTRWHAIIEQSATVVRVACGQVFSLDGWKDSEHPATTKGRSFWPGEDLCRNCEKQMERMLTVAPPTQSEAPPELWLPLTGGMDMTSALKAMQDAGVLHALEVAGFQMSSRTRGGQEWLGVRCAGLSEQDIVDVVASFGLPVRLVNAAGNAGEA